MMPHRPIIVTGASGFIGQRLSGHLENRGHAVVRWVRTMGDLRDSEATKQIVKDVNPSIIFHLAACSASETEADWKAAADEAAMLQNLAASLSEDARLVYTGSMSEFGYGGVLSETDIRQPRSAYGFAKACATDRALALASIGSFDIRVACLFGVFGPGEGPHRLLPQLVSDLIAGNSVILGNPMRERDFVHVDDVCNLLVSLALADEPPAPIMNIGTGVGVTIRHVCEQVAQLLDADPALLRFGERPERLIDEAVLVADTTLLQTFVTPPPQRWLGDMALVKAYIAELAAAFDRDSLPKNLA